jgi:hypothetical protein
MRLLNMPEINLLAVLIAAVSSFIIGGLWYSPLLFEKAWQRETGMTEEHLKGGNMALIFSVAFVLIFLAALVFAMFLGPNAGLGFGTSAGFGAGLFWAAGSLGVIYLFERRSLKLWLINGGYLTVMFTAIGAILGGIASP